MSWKQYSLMLVLVCNAVLIISTQGQSKPSERKTGDTATFDLPGGATIEMVWIEPGTFIMGSPWDAPRRPPNEGPPHEVTISRGFWLGKYEITQGQWKSVMGTSPWSDLEHWQGSVVEGPNYPAAYISWNDTQEFISKLNQAEGIDVYRLPTEAEWEYACGVGTSTRWWWGDEGGLWASVIMKDYAWHWGGGNIRPTYAHEVGTKLPNPWGLYDMYGNVWEWCQDWYGPYSSGHQVDPTGPSGLSSGWDRIFRGGSFMSSAVRTAGRNYSPPTRREGSIGARLLRQEHATSVSPSTWGRIKSLFK